MDQLSAMRVFRRVVELDGFAAAARDLGMSNAAVSKQVGALEAQLGARLLNRTTRRLSLTEPGRLFHARTVRILDDLAEAEAEMSDHAAAPRGRLRINAPMSFGIRHLPPVLASFRRRFPDLALDLALSDRIVDLIDESFDVAIRIASLTDSSLIARRLCTSRRVIVASPGYLTAEGEPETLAALHDRSCLIYGHHLAGEEVWTFEGPHGHGEFRVNGAFAANNGDLLAAAAADGLGIALLPLFIVADHLRDGRLVTVLRDHTPTGAGVFAVYPATRHLSAKVRVFIDHLAAAFGEAPPWELSRA
jgi:DNA-binding transcriptional LysR family regulator